MPSPHAYEFGPFRLDPQERLLLREGEPVQLTPKAFDLLLLLVKNRGHVLGKEEMLRALWPDTFVEEANLTQNIFTLRKALGERQGGTCFIETVPKKGYRFVASTKEVEEASPSYRQLTFRRGPVHAARFSPDARSVLYDAAWDGGPLDIFSVNPESLESRPLGLSRAALLAVSTKGEMAVSMRRQFLRGYVHSGTLARIPADGGRPSEVFDEVHWADWSPDGTSLAVVREAGGRCRLEFPAGKTLYETGGWISHPRVSPAGNAVAFIDHPIEADDRGQVSVVNLEGEVSVLSGGWISAQGLAWSAAGDEVCFTAAKTGNARALYAVTPQGRQRLVERVAGSLTLQDISRDGRVLLTRDTIRLGIVALPPGDECERDLSWLDWSLARDLSNDGRLLLFTEAGEAGGSTYSVYLRETRGSTALRLGAGSALALSPDCKLALARLPTAPPQLVLLPTGAGEPKLINRVGINYHPWACWFPDGERILFSGNEPGRGTRLYAQDVAGGKPLTITPEVEGVHLTSPQAISPDGREVVALGPDQEVCSYSLEGRGCRRVAGASRGDIPVRWSADGKMLFVRQRGELPVRVYRVELATGRKEVWKELMPSDHTGVYEILRILLTPDGEHYAYTYTRELSDLYLIEGLSP